jgi:hypothetical protein
MAMKPEVLKLDELADLIGQGFYEVESMAFVIYPKGIEVLVFMHKLDVYVILPDDFEERGIVVREEKEILRDLRLMFGRELKSIKLYTPNYH